MDATGITASSAYLEVQSLNALGSEPNVSDQPSGFSMRHPHTIGEWNSNNSMIAVYERSRSEGGSIAGARRVSPSTRLRYDGLIFSDAARSSTVANSPLSSI